MLYFSDIYSSSTTLVAGIILMACSTIVGAASRPKVVDERELRAFGTASWLGTLVIVGYALLAAFVLKSDPQLTSAPVAVMGGAIAFLCAYLGSFHVLRHLPFV